MHHKKKHHILIFLIATAVVIGLYLFAHPLTTRLDLLTEDLFYKVRGPIAPGDAIVIATIDEKSIDILGRWPWQRKVIADLIDSLTAYEVAVMGFDVVFSSPETGPGLEQLLALKEKIATTPSSNKKLLADFDQAISLANNDEILRQSIKRSDLVVLGYFFHYSQKDLKHLSENEMASYLANIKKSRFSGIKKDLGADLSTIPFQKAYAVEATIAEISNNSDIAGYFNFNPEADGTIRKVPLIVQYRDMVEMEDENDYVFPPLSISMLRKALDIPLVMWVDESRVYQTALMAEEPFIIPVNNQGEMLINHYGPAQSFRHISISDIISGNVDKELLQDKIVLIGPTATALGDLHITPFDKLFPGVEIHAAIMENILNGEFLSPPPVSKDVIDLAAILTIGLFLLFLLPRLGSLAGACLIIFLMSSILAGSYFLFNRMLMMVSPIAPLVEITFFSIAIYTYSFAAEQKEKRFIRGAFNQYLSPEVINNLIKNPASLQLGGVRKEMTAFFSDIAGFTTIAESLTPEKLVELLNEYLTAMTNIILKHNGTVDKYEGDAIIAFFGAPLDDPDHAKKCCLMALEMEQELFEMAKRWDAQYNLELSVRMGINSGPMIVGNMGSANRMDYTIMGDSVNLAARLEGVNKVYQTTLMISQYTYALCRDFVEVRELDTVRVKGKNEPVVIYELNAPKEQLSEDRKKLLELYNEAHAFYKSAKWQQATEAFANLSQQYPEDGPAKVYLTRCRNFSATPPPPSWDGVHILTSK